jgi:hypothetical protein
MFISSWLGVPRQHSREDAVYLTEYSYDTVEKVHIE